MISGVACGTEFVRINLTGPGHIHPSYRNILDLMSPGPKQTRAIVFSFKE